VAALLVPILFKVLAGFIPTNLYTELLDGAIQVSKDEAYDFTRRAKEEGMLVGISSGASAVAKLSEIPENAKVLTFATILENTI
jgi:cysteine synthase A